MNFENLKELKGKNLVDGLDFSSAVLDKCEVCLKGKLCQNSFPKESQTRTKDLLELLHCVLCGPMRTTSSGGAKYFLLITDDYSRYEVCLFHEVQVRSFE